MSRESLEAALKAVNWQGNVDAFLNEPSNTTRIADCNHRIATWSKQLEVIDSTNPALSFIREMQVAGHFVPALTALGLYKPAAGAMRTMLETALYYTYFRTHLVELSTLARDTRYYITKAEVIEYHNLHTRDFKDIQAKCGLIAALNEWYSDISAICHGQIPGGWVTHTGLASIKHSPGQCKLVTDKFSDGEAILHKWLLCTVGRELWADFASGAKKELLRGLPGDLKTLLGLDSA